VSKECPLIAKGFSVGGVGVAAVFEVRNLKSVNDFAGIYTGVTMAATAVKGKGPASYQNSKGAYLGVRAKTEGVALSLGASGFEVSFTK